jgi:hypothetical protein
MLILSEELFSGCDRKGIAGRLCNMLISMLIGEGIRDQASERRYLAVRDVRTRAKPLAVFQV